MDNDIIPIHKDWVAIEDYQFKILILTSVLAEKNCGFRGTLTIMCEWLGIANAPKNTKRIKEAIKELQEKEYIFYNEEGRTHHISITNKGLKDKRVVKIKKQWIEAIKKYNIVKNGNVNRSWDIMLKELIVIEDKIKEATGTIITMKEIAKEIGRSEVTAGKYLKALTNCDFGDGYKITKKLKYDIEKGENGENDYIICLGTQINSGLEWKNETKP
jgi:predicted transcriptional regulator